MKIRTNKINFKSAKQVIVLMLVVVVGGLIVICNNVL